MHYWRLIGGSWFIAIIGTFPTLSLTTEIGSLWPFVVLGGFPAMAHIYGFAANIRHIKNFNEPGRIGPLLAGIAYILAVIIATIAVGLLNALLLPIGGVILAVLSYGLFFTGFAPLLGFWLSHLLLDPHVTKHSLVLSIALMTASWLMAIITGYNLLNS